MIVELPEDKYNNVKPLIQGRKDENVHLLGVIDRNNRGKIFVDNMDKPPTNVCDVYFLH